MADLSTCLSLVGLSKEDRAELGTFIQSAGDPARGVETYSDTLLGELVTLRGQIVEGMENAGQVPDLDISVATAVRSQDADVLLQVPVERVIDADGNEVARTVSRQELAAELDANDEFTDQLEICAS
jgi:hypothetical protein